MRNCYVYDNGKRAACFQACWDKCADCKRVRKDSSEKSKRTSQCLEWHYAAFPLFLAPYNSSLILLDSLVSKYNENI